MSSNRHAFFCLPESLKYGLLIKIQKTQQQKTYGKTTKGNYELL